MPLFLLLRARTERSLEGRPTAISDRARGKDRVAETCDACFSSEAYLQFDLCRQPQGPSLFVRSSQAEMLLVEEVVREDPQKNWADIDVPNPREYHMCTCISRP